MPPSTRSAAAPGPRRGARSSPPTPPPPDPTPPTSGQVSMEAVVGRNIRALRRARNLTLEVLAAACALTKGQMSKIETGQGSSPLSTIDRIARALEVEPGTLLRRKDGSNWHVLRRAELSRRQAGLTAAPHHYEQLFPSVGFASPFQPMHGRLAGAAQLQSFRYPGAVFVLITRGRVVYEYSGERIPLGPGDIFYCDGRQAHGPVEIVDGPVDYLLVIGDLQA